MCIRIALAAPKVKKANPYLWNVIFLVKRYKSEGGNHPGIHPDNFVQRFVSRKFMALVFIKYSNSNLMSVVTLFFDVDV